MVSVSVHLMNRIFGRNRIIKKTEQSVSAEYSAEYSVSVSADTDTFRSLASADRLFVHLSQNIKYDTYFHYESKNMHFFQSKEKGGGQRPSYPSCTDVHEEKEIRQTYFLPHPEKTLIEH